MKKPPYFALGDMIEMIEEPFKSQCLSLYLNHGSLFKKSPGSSHNHQAWKGGYFDHVRECMNLAIVQYRMLDSIRSLPFSMSDALLILFLHDLEKPWKYKTQGSFRREQDFSQKDFRREFRLRKIKKYGLTLTPVQSNALQYVEGEGNDYTHQHRVMNELAAFCHIIDVLSARLWFDYPKSLGEDPWPGAQRING